MKYEFFDVSKIDNRRFNAIRGVVWFIRLKYPQFDLLSVDFFLHIIPFGGQL